MTLRIKILVYLALIHLMLGSVALVSLWERRIWLLAAEALFLVSAVAGWLLVREFFVPLELIRTGTELIRERDFGSRFREVGQPEMDHLIQVYNRMAAELREERVKLVEQHALLDKILRASPSGIVILDFDERVVLVNPAGEALLRLPAGRIGGRRLAELDSPLALGLALIPQGSSAVLPLQGGRRVRCRRTGFIDRGFERSFLSIEELTEELRASERAAYDKLIRMMSHEVNNSAGAVGSLLESCRAYRERLAGEERADFERALDVAVRRLRSLDVFMSGFADVVRLPDPDRRPCDVGQLVSEIVLLMAPEMERRRIRYELAIDELPPIEADRDQLEQVLVNVLKNAMESIGEGGRIEVRLGREAGVGCLTVRDDGGGIPADVEARLFTPFFSTKRDGRGLGLTLVQEILARHGFDFALAGLDGSGAEFRVLFT